MSSTILYKFRSGTTFEALPLPGSAARLFDVKKAIVLAKKLDQGSIEFDLSVRDATTNEEYIDESMLLPRGTRLIVQRLPAAKGYGFLSRMARNQYGGAPPPPTDPRGARGGPGTPMVVPSNFYTIDGRGNDDDEEFVSSSRATNTAEDEEKELAALRAATDSATSSGHTSSSGVASVAFRGGRPGGPPHMGGRGPPGAPGASDRKPPRRNADPELREQEKQLQPKKRATGIPRTFLSLSKPPPADGAAETESSGIATLQPNAIGFEELKNRGGGQSESASGSKRDLDSALKITATSIPDYLQCAMCQGIAKDAMILPWDPEGRTVRETCIRDALTQNGFRCPLTGMEGVSPDDLLPNHALRKAAEQFVKGVMEKMAEIDMTQVDDDEVTDEAGNGEKGDKIFEGDDTGVIVSKRATIAERKKKHEEDDPFGAGDDDFGGDVFAVEVEKPEETEAADKRAETSDVDQNIESPKKEEKRSLAEKGDTVDEITNSAEEKQAAVSVPEDNAVSKTSESTADSVVDHSHQLPSAAQKSTSGSPTQQGANRREATKRRGPPVGYAMGPAGGAVGGPQVARNEGRPHADSSPRGGPRHDAGFEDGHQDRSYHGGRGRGDRGGRFGGRYGGRGRWDNRQGRGHRGRGERDHHAQHSADHEESSPTQREDVSNQFSYFIVRLFFQVLYGIIRVFASGVCRSISLVEGNQCVFVRLNLSNISAPINLIG